MANDQLELKKEQAKDKEERAKQKEIEDSKHNDLVLDDLDKMKTDKQTDGSIKDLRCFSCGVDFKGKPWDNTDSISSLQAKIKQATDWLEKAKRKLTTMQNHPKRNLCESCKKKITG